MPTRQTEGILHESAQMHSNSPCAHSPLLFQQGKLGIFLSCGWNIEENSGESLKNGNSYTEDRHVDSGGGE